MEQQTLNLILIIASLCGAITTIYNFIQRPTKAIKDKVEIKHKAETEELVKTITNSVMDQVKPLISEVKQINLEQSDIIEKLKFGQLDLLRQQILYLYNHHLSDKTLTKDEMEQLHKLYEDYVLEGGNSFVTRLYKEMENWTITP